MLELSSNCQSSADAIVSSMKDYINDDLTYNEIPIDQLVIDVVDMANSTVVYLNETGREDIITTYNDSVIQSKIVVNDYADFCIAFFEDELAPVQPIGDIYLGFVNLACHTILDEFNMAWAAIGFVLLFSVPMVIGASYLESVSRKDKMPTRHKRTRPSEYNY